MSTERRALRQLRTVWLSVFLSSLAMMSVLPHLPRYLEERFELAGNEWALFSGLVFGAAPLAAACSGPLWGALGDRFGRKWNLIRAQLAILGFLALFPLFDNVWSLVVLRFVQGLCAGWVAPAFSLATAPWPSERRGRVLGRLQIAMTLGLLFGPVLGAEVLACFGRSSPFWFGSCLAVLALAATGLVREDRSTLRDGTGGAAKGRLLDGFRLVRGRPALAAFLLAMCLGRLGIALVEPQLALFVREELGPLTATAPEQLESAIDRCIALLSTVLAMGVLLTGAFWSRMGDRRSPVGVLAVAGAFLGLSLIGMSLVTSSAALLLCRGTYAIGFAGLMPLSYQAISRITPRDSIGAAYALNQSSVQLALGVGFIVGGLLEGAIQVRSLLVVAGCIGLVAYASLPLIRAWKRSRDLATGAG